MNKLSQITNVLKRTFFPSERRRIRAEKLLAEFMSTCCIQAEDASRVGFREAYDAYCNWCRRSTNEPLRKRAFAELMERRFRRERSGGHIYFSGLSLS